MEGKEIERKNRKKRIYKKVESVVQPPKPAPVPVLKT